MKLNINYKKILIIGGTGFIGFHLCKFFNNIIYKFTSISKTQHKNIRKLQQIKYIYRDISKFKEIEFLKKMNFKYVINCGGYVDHKNKKKNHSTHFLGCKNLIKIFKRNKIKLFIHIGSSSEYGNLKSPHIEKIIGNAKDVYGKAKLLATQHILKKKIPFIILRPYQLYGPYQVENRFIPFIINSCLKDVKFPCSEGNQLRDFLYIDDFVRAVELIIKNKNLSGHIFNIGSEKPIEIKKIILKINKLIKKGTPQYGKIKLRQREQAIVYPSIKKIKRYINWVPKINLDKGLKKTFDYFKKIKKGVFD